MEEIGIVLWDISIEIALAVLAAAAAIGLAYLRRGISAFELRTGIVIDEQNRHRLESALTNAIADAEARIGRATPDEVAAYLRQFNPETLRHFRLEGAQLFDRIEAAIAQRRTGTSETIQEGTLTP